jgi:hypothetical protein
LRLLLTADIHSLATQYLLVNFQIRPIVRKLASTRSLGLRRLLPLALHALAPWVISRRQSGSLRSFRGPLGPIQRLAHGGGKLFGRQWLLNQFHVGIETPLMNDRVA